jgi:hypothetical protein
VTNTSQPRDELTIHRLRSALLIAFLLGLFGTGAELLLVEHTEDFWQQLPLGLMAISLAVLGWSFSSRGRTGMRIFQATMILFAISGFAGLFLHYQANVEFELEMYPNMKGWELFWKANQGTAPPALAPGAMILLGLLGLAHSYRHPILARRASEESPNDETNGRD